MKLPHALKNKEFYLKIKKYVDGDYILSTGNKQSYICKKFKIKFYMKVQSNPFYRKLNTGISPYTGQ